MNIGIYARVSTQKQADKGISIEDQIRRGKDYCHKNKYTYEIFKDEGYSGDLPIEERPALTKLFEKIFLKNKEIDGIFVVDFDRLTRNVKEALTIREILIENDVQLLELGGVVNLKDPTQELLLGIKGLLGAFERKKTIVRIKRTLETSALQGKALGGKLTNYGYTKDENKILIIEPIEAKIVKRIYKLSLEGNGTKKIAETLNKEGVPTKRMNLGGAKLKVRETTKRTFIWRDAVIHKILVNPIYKGERHFRDLIIQCPAIIDESVFDAVQESLKKRTNFKDTTNKYFYLLKGLLVCAKCSNKFYGRKREDLSDNQYICLSQRYRSEFCGSRGINITKLEDWVWDSIMSLPLDLKKALKLRVNEQQVKSRNRVVEELQQNIIEFEKEADMILTLFREKGSQNNRFTKKRLTEIENEILEIEKQIQKLERQNIKSEQEVEILTFLNDKLFPLKKGKVTNEKKQSIARALINQIKIFWDEENLQHQIQINYKFDKHSEILLTKNLTLSYKKMGYSIRAKNYLENIRVELRSPSPRSLDVPDSKYLHIHHQTIK
jgi:DNA invertase Pin-like site-specific DNA recombinase